MTDHELATKLKELADAPAPAPRIDVDRARRIGGRRRRVRTTVLILGCAAVTAGGVIAVSAFGRGDGPAPVAVPVAVPVAPAPHDNPLVAKASFGWLPEPITGIEYGVGSHGDYALAIGRGEMAPMIWLSVSDQEPGTPPNFGGQPKRVPVRIGDRDGYWLTTNTDDPLNSGDSYLFWPTPDGRWAQLHTYYLALPDLQQALVRVAAGVTFGNRPVPLPLHVTGLPESFHLADGNLWRRPDADGVPWRAVLQYSSNGALATITVSLPGGHSDGLGEPHCVTKNGLQACVTMDRPTGIDPAELLGRITLLGPDEAQWTTHVIG